MNRIQLFFLALAFAGQSSAFADDPSTAPLGADTYELQPHPDGEKWKGTYVSVSETGKLHSTVLSLDNGFLGYICYKMRRSAALPDSEDAIGNGKLNGSVLVDGNTLYLPTAHGIKYSTGIELMAMVQRYNRVEISGHIVLLTDDSLARHRKGMRLTGPGVLIRQANSVTSIDPLGSEVSRPSINILYQSVDGKGG
ncbi:hypothetical protein [Neorhodopirellula lusitana]|uniref:hypothetical protein n=1 Tax=Neorhodopirellula lusitana TaxID=445327 RepID=UPI0038511A0E